MWHRVATELAADFTVVATDLRGYGDSGKPDSADDHGPYAMRAIAVGYMLDHWSAPTASRSPDVFPAEVRAEYVAKLSDPATIHTICEEYRAAATVDCEHDEADRGFFGAGGG
jgi:pimeloyl-ACP methyl ester carboxylesterase